MSIKARGCIAPHGGHHRASYPFPPVPPISATLTHTVQAMGPQGGRIAIAGWAALPNACGWGWLGEVKHVYLDDKSEYTCEGISTNGANNFVYY